MLIVFGRLESDDGQSDRRKYDAAAELRASLDCSRHANS